MKTWCNRESFANKAKPKKLRYIILSLLMKIANNKEFRSSHL